MKALRLNIFTVLLFLALLAGVLQVDLLRKGLLSTLDLSRVMHNSNIKQSQGCAGCGTEITPSAPRFSFKPEKIVMNTVGIDLSVVSVPLKNGTWEVQPRVANYAEGTSLINEKEGNVGIFGHARPDAFLQIKQLQEGDEIVVSGKTYKAIYKVARVDTISPSEINVFYPEKKPVLTLITCDGAWDQHRYMVRAELVRIDKNK